MTIGASLLIIHRMISENVRDIASFRSFDHASVLGEIMRKSGAFKSAFISGTFHNFSAVTPFGMTTRILSAHHTTSGPHFQHACCTL